MIAQGGNWFVAAIAAAALAGCATTAPAPDYPALVASPDRSEADRTNDVRSNAVIGQPTNHVARGGGINGEQQPA